MNVNNDQNNHKSFVVKLSLWAQGRGIPGASPAWLTKIAQRIASSENPKLIEKFVKEYGIDHTQATRCASDNSAQQCAKKYGTLSEFFTRHIKDIHVEKGPIVSPATCKAMLFDSFEASRIWVKGQKWSASRLLQLPLDFQDYALGIFRLRPKDYHRFHAPIFGTVTKITHIHGGYLSVDPVVVGSRNVFTENNRVVVEISSPLYGQCYFVAVGAAGVGSVHMTISKGDTVTPGQELGYFDFGGSTVILMIPRQQQQKRIWRVDVRTRSAEGKETYMNVGTRIVL